MSKRKGIRVLSMLALCAVLVCSFSLTAFAYADDTEQNLPVTEATQPEEMPETEPPAETLPAGEPIDDVGNAPPAICCMTKPPISSSLPFRRKTATPSIS